MTTMRFLFLSIIFLPWMIVSPIFRAIFRIKKDTRFKKQEPMKDSITRAYRETDEAAEEINA
jgi:hypothetical protein